jgi:hypothetical protein
VQDKITKYKDLIEKLDQALEKYKRETRDIPNAKAIEERHELEDKVAKYTKMLHKF